MAYNRLSLPEKLLTKTKQVGECLIWTGYKCPKGYGLLRLDGRWQRAHRLMWALHNGPIEPGAVVMHKCDTPACINIGHLALGSQADNVKDMHAKNRARFLTGAANNKTKLTEKQVAAIRRRYVRYSRADGAGQLGKEFGVSKESILAIIHRRTWR